MSRHQKCGMTGRDKELLTQKGQNLGDVGGGGVIDEIWYLGGYGMV